MDCRVPILPLPTSAVARSLLPVRYSGSGGAYSISFYGFEPDNPYEEYVGRFLGSQSPCAEEAVEEIEELYPRLSVEVYSW